MDPVSLTAISLATTAAAGGSQAYGQAQAGKAGAAQYRYQAGIAKMNADIAKQNADFARASGEVEAQQGGMKTRAQLGAARVAQGASGLDVNKGTHVKVRESIADVGAHNVEIIRNNAARKAYGYEVEAANATAQGRMAETAAVNTTKASKIAVMSTILGTASNMFGKFQTASQTGMFGGPAGTESHHLTPVRW